MKVLHITNAYPYPEYASYGIFIKEQVDSLIREGIDTDVIFINARKNGLIQYVKSIRKIKNQLQRNKYDIVHCHHQFSLFPILFIQPKQPVLLSLLGDINKRTPLNKFMFNILKYIPNKIIIKNIFINSNKYFYLPNGVNMNHFRSIYKKEAKKKLNLNIEKKYILFASNYIDKPLKRYDLYCESIKKIKKIDSNIEPLIMSGIERDLVPYYYNASDILLLTSDHEGSPNVVKEAMACDLPIVSTNVGNVAEMFRNTKGLYVSKSHSVDDIVEEVKKALKVEKSEGSKRLIELGLDMESTAKILKGYYTELMNA